MSLYRMNCLRRGEPLLATDGRCPPLLVVGVTVAIIAISLIVAQALVGAVTALCATPGFGNASGTGAGGGTGQLPGPAATVLFLLGMQSTMIALTLVAASIDGRSLSVRLALPPSPMGGRTVAEAIGGVTTLVTVYTVVVYTAGFTDIVTDLRPFIGLLQSPVWPLAVLAVAVGAPVAEELLFRGYLLPTLARSRLRMPGGAVLSTLAWTGLHAGYSATGMIEVFLIGLYFCWITWRSGSVRLAIACHVVINTLTLGLIALLFVR